MNNLIFADNIKLITTDEDEVNENDNILNEHRRNWKYGMGDRLRSY